MEQFYKKMATILEVDEVGPQDILRDFEAWDSLSVLTIVSMAQSDYKTVINAVDIRKLETAGELYELIQSQNIK